LHAKNQQSADKRPGTGRGYESLADELRDRLTQGTYQPGDRLPTREQLADEFDTTKQTIQRAMQLLIDNGFVVARGRSGTFVSDAPPHLCRYALAFSGHPGMAIERSNSDWTIFAEVVHHIAPEMAIPGQQEFANFYCLSEEQPDFERYQEMLLAQAQAKALSGIIIPNYPSLSRDFLNQIKGTGIPVVAMPCPTVDPSIPGIPIGEGIDELFIASMAAAGVKRVARISLDNHLANQWLADYRELHPCLDRHGLESKPEWFYQVPKHAHSLMKQVLRLLFSMPTEQQPDGLIVTDEYLLKDVEEVLHELQLVVSHASFPVAFPNDDRVQRIGYDVYEFLDQAIHALNRSMDGRINLPGPFVAPISHQEFQARKAQRIQRKDQFLTSLEEGN